MRVLRRSMKTGDGEAFVLWVDDLPTGTLVQCEGCSNEHVLEGWTDKTEWCPYCKRELLYPDGAEW